MAVFSNNMRLWYDRPAAGFNEMLPLGNGRLGVMAGGGILSDLFHLNEDTLWAGRCAPEPRPEAQVALAAVRSLLLDGNYREAQELVEKKMLTGFNQPYLPAGDLQIEFPFLSGEVQEYCRELDLQTACGKTTVRCGGGCQVREFFCSAPDEVFVLRITNEGLSGGEEAVFCLDAALRHRISTDQCDIQLEGDVPSSVVWPGVDDRYKDGEGIEYDEIPPRRYVVRARVVSSENAVCCCGNRIAVRGAGEILLLLAIGSTVRHEDPVAACIRTLDAAQAKGYARLQADHEAEYQRLFGRVQFCLGPVDSEAERLPTCRRLERCGNGAVDTGLESLLFHYGRYLLISSSRPGCQPANLQGIWNDQIQPPWWSNYTININTEMNYWPAEVCNLAECHEPLFDMIEELCISGRKTARIHYGCNGWVAHHQTDFLRQTTPVGELAGKENPGAAQYAMWPLGGAWLCRHLWEHYLYSCDEHFLVQRAWPLMRESAEFFLDWLVEDAQGFLTTAPSTSPENSFLLPDGNRGSVCRGSAMDLSIIRELFTHCLEAVRILRLQGDSVADGIRSALPRLAPLRIGAQGQVMEWNEDWPEGEHPHRHLSQLFGLFPGAEMTPERSPHLAAAARRSLELRGDGGTGWSLAWKISLRARLGEGDRAHRLLKRLLVPVAHDVRETANDGGGVYPNLLAACPPFQIDANFGSTAGMAEMLLQSHEDNENGTVVHLLPALPAAWPEGSIHGLCARGGIHVRMEWENGALTAAVLTSTVSGQVTVRYQDRCVQFALDAGTVIRLDGALNKLSA